MFCCIRKHLHPTQWLIPSENDVSNSNRDCFLCLINQLSIASITSVQKQVALQIVAALLNKRDCPICDLLRENLPIGYQLIDITAELQSEAPLQDIIVSVCVATIDVVMKDDGYKHLLAKFIEGIDTVNEEIIQFCISVASSLMPLDSMYAEIFLFSNDDLVIPLLDKAQFMDEKMTVSLIYLLIPAIEHINCLADVGRYKNVLTQLVPLVNSWLTTSQSLEFKTSIMMLLKEFLQQRDSTLCLLSVGNDSHSLSQTLSPPDCPFLMGLKRMMSCKEAELTIYCVCCLTQVLHVVHGSEYVMQVMASDLPEFVFESLHTIDNRQLESILSCLQVMTCNDEFFLRCHAVYGIDATVKVVKEAVNSQRLSIAVSGLHLLWCFLDKQPESMPLLLNNSWKSCFQVVCQALQHENNTLYVSGLQVAASFLSPQHWQRPVDTQAILTLMCTLSPKSQMLLNNHDLNQPCSSSKNNDTQELVLNSFFDIFTNIISLFQSDAILPGNDKESVSEIKQVLQSVTYDWILSTVIFSVPGRSDTAEKYLKCIESTIFIQLYDKKSREGTQSSDDFFYFLMKFGVPWNILGCISSVRCPSLEEQASKLVVYILGSCVESLPPALHFDPEQLYSGLIQLEWTEGGLSLDCLPKSKHALLAEMAVMYFSYLCSNRCRPFPPDALPYLLNQVFNLFPAYLSWHPMLLRSTVYFLAVSESLLQDKDACLEKEYESAVINELEKTPLDLWYTNCIEILPWTLSSNTRHVTVGTKAVEYWIHQLSLADKIKDEMKTTLLCLKDCLRFYQSIIDLLPSNTVGKLASSVLIQAMNDGPTGISKEMILKWTHEQLENVFSQVPNINETAVDNIMRVLYVLINGNSFESSDSYLHNVKTVCQCVKYLTQQESESCRMMNALKYLSALVEKFTTQESKITIPPLMQNTKIAPLLTSVLSGSNPTIVSYALILCAWFSTNGTDYQTASPLIITNKQMLSLLASCKLTDASAILTLVKSALIRAQCENESSGAVLFVRSHHTHFSTHQIFNDVEINQIHWYALQYFVQDSFFGRKLAFDILEMTLIGIPQASSQSVHNPWNTVLVENILTVKADSSLTQVDVQMCSLMSASSEIWTSTSANSFLLALTTTDLKSLDIVEVERILSQIKETSCHDNLLLSEVENKIASIILHVD